MSIEAKIQALLDRELIRDCLYRYCRGIDRVDEATLRAVYWPDAIDNHGAYRGSASGFVDWAMKTLPSIERGVHQIHNVLIALGDGEADVESYFTALQRQTEPDGRLVEWRMAGRYIDRFEKRAEEWRIALRTVVFDWVEEAPPPAGTEAERFGRRQPIGGKFPNDPVYAPTLCRSPIEMSPASPIEMAQPSLLAAALRVTADDGDYDEPHRAQPIARDDRSGRWPDAR